MILVGRDLEKLKQVKKEAQTIGSSNVEIYSVDLSNPKQINDFVKNLTKIDGIINNAGIWQKKTDLDKISDEEIIAVLNTNLTGMVLLTKKVLPLLRKAPEAFIVNISSRSGWFPDVGQSVYAASKYGVRGFTEVLRIDLKETNIRVAGIYQGGTNTGFFTRAGEDWPAEKLASFIPPSQLAQVITFLITRPLGIWLPEIRIEKN
ncbi:SDR family oxidoreductase [Candidatus Microgenomates bacterium]|nr:SDR family oxidoreductase [Candidatus Microgenomates bacterium]